jgi:hypothetical protein
VHHSIHLVQATLRLYFQPAGMLIATEMQPMDVKLSLGMGHASSSSQR